MRPAGSPVASAVVRTPRQPRLVLASASPARLKLLRAAGIEPDVLVSGVDELVVQADLAEELSLTLAGLKASAVVDRIGPTSEPGTLVLGCDSVLAFEGEILGKPADAEEATRRWLGMRGRSGVLHTGHSLVDVTTGRTVGGVAATVVHFADITEAEIAAYVATGEPMLVAGGFTIDGFGGPFVERVEGDPGTVIGLSLPMFRTLLSELGVLISDLWTAGSSGTGGTDLLPGNG